MEIRKKLRGIKRISSIRNTTPLDNVEGGEDVMHLELREGYLIFKETEEGIDSLVFSKE